MAAGLSRKDASSGADRCKGAGRPREDISRRDARMMGAAAAAW
jgi:hypothetical protein